MNYNLKIAVHVSWYQLAVESCQPPDIVVICQHDQAKNLPQTITWQLWCEILHILITLIQLQYPAGMACLLCVYNSYFPRHILYVNRVMVRIKYPIFHYTSWRTPFWQSFRELGLSQQDSSPVRWRWPYCHGKALITSVWAQYSAGEAGGNEGVEPRHYNMCQCDSEPGYQSLQSHPHLPHIISNQNTHWADE